MLTATLEDARRSRALRAVTAGGVDALVDGVVRMLELELGEQGTAALRASATGVAEAATLATQALGYTPYAEGRSALERYEQSRSIETAIGLFNRALEQDPRYALAHAGLGEAYWRLYQNERKPEMVTLAEQHCQRALALDDLLARPWITLGMIHAGTGRADEATADFERALDRDPRYADVYRERGFALQRLGRWDEAEASYRKAIELRPELLVELQLPRGLPLRPRAAPGGGGGLPPGPRARARERPRPEQPGRGPPRAGPARGSREDLRGGAGDPALADRGRRTSPPSSSTRGATRRPRAPSSGRSRADPRLPHLAFPGSRALLGPGGARRRGRGVPARRGARGGAAPHRPPRPLLVA